MSQGMRFDRAHLRTVSLEGYEGHFEHFDGVYTVGVRDVHG